MKLEDITKTVEKLKWKWAGHMQDKSTINGQSW